ncbi:MAG: LysR substrate-binding domain-containing protein [Acidiferrobacterales bacterium]
MNEKQLINFKQLRCFHAVAEEGSFTQAARALSVGQPSITTHVRALESQFGVELFSRHGHSVELTDLGRTLMQITQRIFSLEKEAAELLSAASGLKVGHLKIGVIGPFQVTQMIVAFSRMYPEVELSVSTGNSQEVLNSLLDFRADVAVLAQDEDDSRFFSVPYSRNRVVIIVGADHPWSVRKEIKIRDLSGQRMVLREVGSATRRALETALEQANVNVRKVLEIGSREAVREAVANGVGIGFALEEEFVSSERLRALQITDADIYIHPHVVCLQERRNAPLIQAFLDVVKDLAAER